MVFIKCRCSAKTVKAPSVANSTNNGLNKASLTNEYLKETLLALLVIDGAITIFALNGLSKPFFLPG